MTALMKKLVADEAGQDLAEYGIALAVIGTIAAAVPVSRGIARGEALRIMTGAPLTFFESSAGIAMAM